MQPSIQPVIFKTCLVCSSALSQPPAFPFVGLALSSQAGSGEPGERGALPLKATTVWRGSSERPGESSGERKAGREGQSSPAIRRQVIGQLLRCPSLGEARKKVIEEGFLTN